MSDKIITIKLPHPNPPLAKGRELELYFPHCKREVTGFLFSPL